jgi:hypothetical protein
MACRLGLALAVASVDGVADAGELEAVALGVTAVLLDAAELGTTCERLCAASVATKEEPPCVVTPRATAPPVTARAIGAARRGRRVRRRSDGRASVSRLWRPVATALILC